MSLHVFCPNCNNIGKVPEEYVGRSIRCKRCSNRFTVAPPASNPELPETRVYLEDMPSILVDLPICVPG